MKLKKSIGTDLQIRSLDYLSKQACGPISYFILGQSFLSPKRVQQTDAGQNIIFIKQTQQNEWALTPKSNYKPRKQTNKTQQFTQDIKDD